MRLRSLARWLLVACTLASYGCPTTPPTPEGFQDHCEPRFTSRAKLLEFGDLGELPIQVKFVLTRFHDEAPGDEFFLDSRFYEMHDEWYWFRLLNGEPIDGWLVPPPEEAGEFESVDAIREAWPPPTPKDEMPLDLMWHGGERLYSRLYYDAALSMGEEWGGKPRFFGIGSIVYYPANPKRAIPEELWLFELEYIDRPDEELIGRFFQRLEPVLPKDVAPELKWLSRGGPLQNALVEAIRAGGGPYADRVLTYRDLVVDGEVVPYNEGITAGFVKRFAAGELGGASVAPNQIAVLEAVPDYLPPVAGIVTAVPQTPLAHLNLLAKARGTPNAYVAGAFEDDQLEDWSMWHTPVILKVAEEGVSWKPISKLEYDHYLALRGAGSTDIPQIDLTTAPHFRDLTSGGVSEMTGLVPLTGGKCAGFLSFNDLGGIETPLAPLCVTIRGYAEHFASFRPITEQFLGNQYFNMDARVRFLVLEGEDDFLAEHAGDPDALEWFQETWKPLYGQTQMGMIGASDGIKGVLRSKPLDGTFAAELETTLAERYADLAATQGLRFRSSSTAEDVPGFNGAGLYDSNTGYLHPLEQPTPENRNRTLEWALKKTWASYWSFEAFEERRIAGIDHLSGNMGVLVHPIFDDPHELANGVITFYRREGSAVPLEMVLNVQQGALSVTNPDPQNPAQPEIDRVIGPQPSVGTVERVQASSEVNAGEHVLSDAELQQLFERVATLSELWLQQLNADPELAPAQRSSTLVLDLEFKKMAGAWPAYASGQTTSDRLVLKQVRVLDNPITVSAEIEAMPVPRDVLKVTAKVVRRTCTSDHLTFNAYEFYTDPAKAAALGLDYAVEPLLSHLSLVFEQEVPGLDVHLPGFAPNYLQLVELEQSGFPDGLWSVAFGLPGWLAGQWGFTEFRIDGAGDWWISDGTNEFNGSGASCSTKGLVEGPSEFLESLLRQ